MRRIVREAAARRRGRGVALARDPGRPDVVRALRRRHHAGARDRARRGPGGVGRGATSGSASSSRRAGCGTRSRRARWRGSRPATRATGPATSSASACPTTSGAGLIADFAPAFAIARRAGLALVPHGGELLGAQAVMETLEHLDPDRIGHGVRCVEDPQVLDAVAEAGVTLEVCPRQQRRPRGLRPTRGRAAAHASSTPASPVALGADDPLLFGSRLADAVRAGAATTGSPTPSWRRWLARGSLERQPGAATDSAWRPLADVDAWLAAA